MGPWLTAVARTPGDDRPDGQDDSDWNTLAVESIVADLDSAHEELRVAEEKLQTQQE